MVGTTPGVHRTGTTVDLGLQSPSMSPTCEAGDANGVVRIGVVLARNGRIGGAG